MKDFTIWNQHKPQKSMPLNPVFCHWLQRELFTILLFLFIWFRLQELARVNAAIAQGPFYKFNGVWKYNHILSGNTNQYPIVIHYWRGGLTNRFPKRVFPLFILILGGPIWIKCYWQVYWSHLDPYELFFKTILILWMKDSRHNY